VNGQLPSKGEQFETSEKSDLALMRTGSAGEIWPLSPLSVTTLVLDR
jgi:hypothetical protein